MKAVASYGIAMLLLSMTGYAQADLRTDYYQRAATRDRDAFHALDINRDGVVERGEIAGDNDFGPRFGDMDRNGDGVVTKDELALYIRDHYRIVEAGATQATMATEHIGDATAGEPPTQQASAK